MIVPAENLTRGGDSGGAQELDGHEPVGLAVGCGAPGKVWQWGDARDGVPAVGHSSRGGGGMWADSDSKGSHVNISDLTPAHRW